MRLALVLTALAGLGAGTAAAQERPKLPADAILFDRSPTGSRSCARKGQGFVEVPGTTTCVRIGGRVVAEAGASGRRVPKGQLATSVTGIVLLDARTDTAYGTFRTVVRVKAGDATGRGSQAYIVTP